MGKNYKILRGLIVKEFTHILRDWRTLILLLGMPGILVLLFGYVMNIEIEGADVGIIDNARDTDSEYIINKLENSGFFEVVKYLESEDDVDTEFKQGTMHMVFVFEKDFSYKLRHESEAHIQLITDGSKLLNVSTLVNYATAIIKEYQFSLSEQKVDYLIIPEIRMFYNPNLDGRYMSLPGLMAFIIMIIASLIASLSIAKEKELGTMELLLSTPVNRYFVMFAKIVPYLVTCFINVLTIIWLSKYAFEIPIVGNLSLLLGTSVLFILTSLALGLLISSWANSQLTALMLALTGLMLPSALLSGMTFPINSLPLFLQWCSHLIPAKWFMIINRNTLLQGATLEDLRLEVLMLGVMVVVFFGLSIIRFRPRVNN